MAYRFALPLADVGPGITPANNARLLFYQVGTTTEITTYSDQALTTANSNPVVASNGLFGDIFLSGDADVTLQDRNGVTIWGPKTIYDPANQLTQSSIAGALNPQTQDEINASVTPTNPQYPQGDLRRYGGVLDGSTDDSSAWASMLAVGGDCYVPEGNSLLSSATLSTLVVRANTKITGAGSERTTVTLSGSTEVRMFSVTNVSNVTFEGMTLRGNNLASAYLSANAIYVTQTGATEMRNFRFRDLRFENFQSDGWLCFHNNNGTAPIRKIWIDDCEFQSESGNARGPTNIAIPAGCIWFEGEETNTTGIVEEAWVRDCWFDCEHTKSAIASWDNTRRITIENPVILNAGQDSAFSDDSACYAIFAYDNSVGAGAAVPTDFKVIGGLIDTPRDCGIYITTAMDFLFDGVTVRGQTSDADTSLPKGAFGINGGNGIIRDAIVDNCQIGFWCRPDSGEQLQILGGNIKNIKASGEGIKSRVGGSVDTGRIIVDGVEVTGTNSGVTGLFMQTTNTGDVLEQLVIRNCEFDCTTNDILLAATAGNVDIDETHIEDVISKGGSAGSNIGTASNDNPVFIKNVTIESSGDFNGLDGRTCTNLHIDGMFLRNKISGSNDMLNLTGANGTMRNVSFQNVPLAQQYTATGSNDMGAEAPNWTGGEGDFVQNLNTAAPDVNDMVVQGWVYASSTWRTLYLSTVSPAT